MDDTPTATFVRQVLGAVVQLDKAMTVASCAGRASADVGRMAGARVVPHVRRKLFAWPNDCTGPIPSRVSDALTGRSVTSCAPPDT
jgi:hypothetical protein